MSFLETRGAVSRALDQIDRQGGPDLDIPALAEEAELSAEWLYRLDWGALEVVELGHLARLCCILGRSPNDILGYEVDE